MKTTTTTHTTPDGRWSSEAAAAWTELAQRKQADHLGAWLQRKADEAGAEEGLCGSDDEGKAQAQELVEVSRGIETAKRAEAALAEAAAKPGDLGRTCRSAIRAAFSAARVVGLTDANKHAKAARSAAATARRRAEAALAGTGSIPTHAGAAGRAAGRAEDRAAAAFDREPNATGRDARSWRERRRVGA